MLPSPDTFRTQQPDGCGGSHASSCGVVHARARACGSTDGAGADRHHYRDGQRSSGCRPGEGDRHRDQQRHGGLSRRPDGRGWDVLGAVAAARRLRRADRGGGVPADHQSGRRGHRRDDDGEGDAAGEHEDRSGDRGRCLAARGSRLEPGAGHRRAHANREPAAERAQLHEPGRVAARCDGEPRKSGAVQRAVQRFGARRPGVADGHYRGWRQRPQPGGGRHRPELFAGSGPGVSDFDGEFRPVHRHRGLWRDQHRDAIGFQRLPRRRILLSSRREHRGLSKPRAQYADRPPRVLEAPERIRDWRPDQERSGSFLRQLRVHEPEGRVRRAARSRVGGGVRHPCPRALRRQAVERPCGLSGEQQALALRAVLTRRQHEQRAVRHSGAAVELRLEQELRRPAADRRDERAERHTRQRFAVFAHVLAEPEHAGRM